MRCVENTLYLTTKMIRKVKKQSKKTELTKSLLGNYRTGCGIIVGITNAE